MMVTVAVCVDSLMKHVLRRSVRKSLRAMSPGRHDNRRQATPSSAAVPPVMTSITAFSSPVLPATPALQSLSGMYIFRVLCMTVFSLLLVVTSCIL